MPDDFQFMRTFNAIARLKTTGFGDDEIALFIRVYQNDFVTPLTDEIAIGVFGAGDAASAVIGPVEFTGVVPATKPIWDEAYVRVRAYYLQHDALDGGVLELGALEFNGTYFATLDPGVVVGAAVATEPILVVTGTRDIIESTETCTVEISDRTCLLRRGDTGEELQRLIEQGMGRFVSDN